MEVVREHEILEKIGSECQDSSWVTEAKIKTNSVENVNPQEAHKKTIEKERKEDVDEQ